MFVNEKKKTKNENYTENMLTAQKCLINVFDLADVFVSYKKKKNKFFPFITMKIMITDTWKQKEKKILEIDLKSHSWC